MVFFYEEIMSLFPLEKKIEKRAVAVLNKIKTKDRSFDVQNFMKYSVHAEIRMPD